MGLGWGWMRGVKCRCGRHVTYRWTCSWSHNHWLVSSCHLGPPGSRGLSERPSCLACQVKCILSLPSVVTVADILPVPLGTPGRQGWALLCMEGWSLPMLPILPMCLPVPEGSPVFELRCHRIFGSWDWESDRRGSPRLWYHGCLNSCTDLDQIVLQGVDGGWADQRDEQEGGP